MTLPPQIYLTPADKVNLKCLGWGFTDKEIAAYRELSIRTIKNEMEHLRLKYNAQNRLQVVLSAIKSGHLVLD